MRRDAWRRAAVLAAVTGVAWSAAGAASAVTKAQRGQKAVDLVQQALRQEIAGSNTDRKELLEAAREQAPDHPAVRWHSGYVREHNRWVKFDEVPDATIEDGRLEAYRRIRDKYAATVEGQMELADWCARRKLADQQRAHLTKVLEIDPEHAEARRLLGHRLVSGTWMTEEEIDRNGRQAQQAAAALAEWRPKIEKILAGLTHRSPAQRDRSTERLQAIRDPSAVGAIETVLASHSQEVATLAIAALDKISHPEAAMALARLALFSPWEPVRQAAAEALRTRDMHSFVPAMLSTMQGPIRSRAELYAAPNGRLTYRHAFLREEQDAARLVVFDTEYVGNVLAGGAPSAVSGVRGQDAFSRALQRTIIAAQQNMTIQLVNQRIAEALNLATQQNLPATAEAWWQWWDEYNEVLVTGAKPVRTSYQKETLSLSDPPTSGPGDAPYPPPPPPRYDCLAAGTRVWTESGYTTIERVQIGQRVLSQNPETGELAYKPVLRTTIRPAGQLVRVQTDDETFDCSGGHAFWVCGQGWTKARELPALRMLHGVTHARRIRSVEPSVVAQTYNLVVADFHTYFVGRAMLLTHDNTVRRPTASIVPGLVQR